MKIKVFTSFIERGLETKVNDFLQDERIEVEEIQYSSSTFYVSVCIIYLEK